MANVKRIAASASACAMAGLMMFGGAQILAYMTDVETATNTFTVGKVTVDLEEPNYPGNDSKEVKELVPNEPVEKDPQAENTGDNAQVLFMSYDSPMADVILVGNNGRQWKDADGNLYINYDETAKTAEKVSSTKEAIETVDTTSLALTEVLPADRKQTHEEILGVMYKSGDNFVSGINSGAADTAKWTLIRTVYVDSLGNEIGVVGEAEEDIAKSAAAVRRVYCYKTLLGKDDKTDPLFDQVYLKNVVEGDVDSSIQKMTVKAYAIQAAHLKAADGSLLLTYDDDGEVAANTVAVEEETAKSIYDIYVGQNGENLTGNNADTNNSKDEHGNTRLDKEMYLKVAMTIDDTKLKVSENAAATAVVDTNYDSVTYAFSVHDQADGADTDGSDVISVDAATGKITALKPGIAYVKVTATKAADAGLDEAKTAEAIVKVVVENEVHVSLSAAENTVMKKDETRDLTATVSVEPADATVTYAYKSSNEKVATVDGNGKVTAHDSGSAVITVTATIDAQDGSGTKTATASYDVFVQN